LKKIHKKFFTVKNCCYIYNIKLIINTMTTSEIRAEIVELINAGIINVSKIAAFFKEHRPEANLKTVKEEAKELVAEARMIMKRGY